MKNLFHQKRLFNILTNNKNTQIPKDADALSNVTTSLLRNDPALDEMARNIQNDYFVGDKSWKVIAEKYVAFYGRKIN